ncbi:MAG: hypothetical protein AB4206_12035 [Xenococcaceae cyanobacterium]
MARIQIHEISPAETPMEYLSDDVAGNITGGGFLGEQLQLFLEKLFDFVLTTLKGCASGDIDPGVCDRII